MSRAANHSIGWFDPFDPEAFIPPLRAPAVPAQGNRDTLYRIHGTNEHWTIGQNVSAGCIRMTNEDVVDLYDRTVIGAKVVVLPSISS